MTRGCGQDAVREQCWLAALGVVRVGSLGPLRLAWPVGIYCTRFGASRGYKTSSASIGIGYPEYFHIRPSAFNKRDRRRCSARLASDAGVRGACKRARAAGREVIYAGRLHCPTTDSDGAVEMGSVCSAKVCRPTIGMRTCLKA